MKKKIFANRNPGCKYCQYYLKPLMEEHPAVCLTEGRKIIVNHEGRRMSRWINCADPRFKNKNKHCPDFKIQNLILMWFRQTLLWKSIFPDVKEKLAPPGFKGH